MNGECEVFKYEYEKFKQGEILNIEIKESSIICNESHIWRNGIRKEQYRKKSF